MHIIDGTLPVYSESDSLLVQKIGEYSHLDRIVPSGPSPTPSPKIFGYEPEHDWCYYYQKASLARQIGDWEEIGRLYDQTRKLGLKAITRTSSLEAYDLFRHDPGSFDLVITDMTMPNMTGEKLAGKILAIRPEIPVILCTGYSEQITEQRAKDIGIQAFVMKPLIMRDLAGTIREVLDKTG